MSDKYPIDITEEEFEDVTVFGQPMLFTCLRADRTTLPERMYLYEVRDGGCDGVPCEIAEHILVNHWGTLISNCPIDLKADIPGQKPYCLVNEDDWNYDGSVSIVKEYMDRHPPVKPKGKERE